MKGPCVNNDNFTWNLSKSTKTVQLLHIQVNLDILPHNLTSPKSPGKEDFRPHLGNIEMYFPKSCISQQYKMMLSTL